MSAIFKQRCPHCEATVLIRDAGMIGKNVPCPRCKDRFVIARPATPAAQTAAASAQASAANRKPVAPGNGKPSGNGSDLSARPRVAKKTMLFMPTADDDAEPALKPAPKPKPVKAPGKPASAVEDDTVEDEIPLKPAAKARPGALKKSAPSVDDDEDASEEDEAPRKPAAKTKPGKKKPVPAADDEEEEEEEQDEEEQEEEESADDEDEAPRKPAAKARPGKKKPAPAAAEDEEEPDEDEEAPLKPSAKSKSGKKKPAADEDGEEQEEEGEDEAPLKSAAKARSSKKKKHAARDEEAEDDSDETGDAGAKPKGRFDALLARFKLNGLNFRSRKAMIGIGVGVVAVVTLVVAWYFIFPRQPLRPISKGPPKIPGPKNVKPPVPPPESKPLPRNILPPKGPPATVPQQDQPKGLWKPVAAGPWLTNLLPPETEQVYRVNFKNLFDPDCPFRLASFDYAEISTGVLNDAVLTKWLGFPVLGFKKKGAPLTGIDDLIVAERFTAPAWSYAVVHVMKERPGISWTEIYGRLNKVIQIEKDGGKKKEPVPLSAGGEPYYLVSETPTDWQDQLGRLGFSVPPSLRHLQPQSEKRKLFAYIMKDQQTLILADEAPLKAFLEARTKFIFWKDRGKGGVAQDDRNDPFSTIRPELKSLLDGFKPKGADPAKVLFTSATIMSAAETSGVLPDQRGLVLYRPRPIWDVTCLLEEHKKRITYLGCCLTQKNATTFRYENILRCQEVSEANDLKSEIDTKVRPKLQEIVDVFVNGPKLPTVPQAVQNFETGTVPSNNTISVFMELSLNPEKGAGIAKATDLLKGLLVDANMELSLPKDVRARLSLRKALYDMRWGIPSHKKEPLTAFPPGLFPAPEGQIDPGLRISWMAGLLPYLGYEVPRDSRDGKVENILKLDEVFARIDFKKPWNDPANVPVARTLIAPFIDAEYPDNLRYVQHPLAPEELAATHFVAVAGVGLDAAELPLTNIKRGITGYNESATFEEVTKGHGLDKTIYLLQVPPGAVYGMTPWIAGGGCTIRGVPARNSIAAFVDRTRPEMVMVKKKWVEKSVARAIMADGSIRFFFDTTPDRVFQAACKLQGPGPTAAEFEEFTYLSSAALPPPRGAGPAPPPVKKPAPPPAVPTTPRVPPVGPKVGPGPAAPVPGGPVPKAK